LTSDVQQTQASSIELLTALRRHPILVLLPLVLFVGAAVVLGLRREATYTANANLSVGHVFVSNPAAISSLIEATRSLASVYSRAVNATEVQKATKRKLDKSAFPVSGRVGATPIPESPLIKVTAVSSSQRSAVAIANASSEALAEYVNRRLRSTAEVDTLARRYRSAALRYRRRAEERNRRARRYEENRSTKNRDAIEHAAAASDSALLDRDAIRDSYQVAVQSDQASPAIEVFSPAAGATSDRSSALQVLVFVGLIGGLAAGAALALLATSREKRRLPSA
jgi:capsular polysaccharide biosynthesis protein